jgi:sulfate transport system substrate-binding protein
MRRKVRGIAAIAVLGIGLSALTACGSSDSSTSAGGGGKKVQLALVAYSTPQAAY